MLPLPTILMIVAAGVVLLSVVVGISTGSFLSVLVVLTLAGIIVFLLYQYGTIKVSKTGDEIDVGFYEKAVIPAPAKTLLPASIEMKEVFYVSGNDYTYDEAAAVCAAYDGDLASYDQVTDAFNKGAEWCGYGWTQGGMALFPTQQSTWDSLQKESATEYKTACGRPGVNGGYFDPKTKFGVNCYGVKPENMGTRLPMPIPGTDPSAFNKMVDKFRSMIKRMTVAPFNRTEWSDNALSGASSKHKGSAFSSMDNSQLLDYAKGALGASKGDMSELQKMDTSQLVSWDTKMSKRFSH